MKRLLAFTALCWAMLPAFMAAQSDIRISAIGPIRDLARSQAWQNGQGGVGNTYIFTPTFPSENIALYATVYGPGSGPSVVTYSVQVTGDQGINSYSTNCPTNTCGASWTQVTAGTMTIATFGTTQVAVQVQGAANIAIPISVSTIAETGSLYIVESSLTATPGSASPGAGFWAAGIQAGPFPEWGGNTTNGAVGTTAGQLAVWQFTLPRTVTINHVSVLITTGAVGGAVNFGIYSAGCASGGTCSKLLDSGAITATAAGIQTVTVPSATLSPGTYYFAQALNTTGVQAYALATEGGAQTGGNLIINAVYKMAASAANLMSGGVLPSTLGALTAQSTSGFEINMTLAYFQT